MPTPFICRKCTVRLARSGRTSPRLNQLLSYTQIAAVEQQPHHRDRGPKSGFLPSQYPHAIPRARPSNGTAVPITHPTPFRRNAAIGSLNSHGGDSVVDEAKIHSTSKPRDTLPTTRLAANNARELKAKILSASGRYDIVREDFVSLYGLSHSEARHAVKQLGRLLRGGVAGMGPRSKLDHYVAWKKDFAVVLRNLSATAPAHKNKPGTGSPASDTVPHDTDAALLRTAWPRLDKDRRQRSWPQMVLSASESGPQTLRTFIQSTFDPTWCPSYIVEDAVYLLFRHHQLAPKNDAQHNGNQPGQELEPITTLVLDILNKCPPRYLALEQPVLALIFPSLPNSELVQLYQLLTNIEHPLHTYTLLHMANRFAKSFETKVHAADVLRILADTPGFNINTPASISVCTSLLSLNENEPLPDEQAAPDVLLEFLFQQGFRPDLVALSALMRNFCIRGRLDTAWKVFDLLVQHGLKPNHHVFSNLLNGSKLNQDGGSLRKIFDIITSHNNWSPVLLNDFLDLIYRENESQPEHRRRQRKKSNNAWRPMVHLYAKFFHLAPLQKLTLFPLKNLLSSWDTNPQHTTLSTDLARSLLPQRPSRLIQPDSTTLCLMFSAHMRSLAQHGYALRYNKHIYYLLKKKDPTALSLIENHGTLIHDIFLRTFLQFKETIHFAIRKVQIMADEANKEMARDGRNLHYPPPSIHTWTILLNGLKNHNDMRGVIAAFRMMTRISKVEPTLPMWNVVIQTFARAGSVDGVVNAVQSLEKAGYQSDERTVRAINLLPAALKEKAITQLEAMRKVAKRHLATQNPPPVRIKPEAARARAPPLGQVMLPDKVKIKGGYPPSWDDYSATPRSLEELATQRQVNSKVPLGGRRL
ncbi:putative pentatricopeptide repeat protein [Rosellinia necatrix]|uniref:Putative pentatricopeptide repeat protein n=1 Tax=Rosellinia necatrix TaxID=77044 RepID=A0A1S7UIS6_ROSNE|nr:putative pentatricopeptide repeat protein [Rosellinia necatrix]